MGRNTDATSLIAGALRLSAHVLASRPQELPSQLQSRLVKFDDAEIIKLRIQIESETKWPWMISHWPSMAAPDGALIQTLIGHTNRVTGLVLTPGDKREISHPITCKNC